MSLLRIVLHFSLALNEQVINTIHLVKVVPPVNKENSFKFSHDNHAHTLRWGDEWLMCGISNLLIENCLIDEFLNKGLGKYLILLLYFVYESKETNFTSF